MAVSSHSGSSVFHQLLQRLTAPGLLILALLAVLFASRACVDFDEGFNLQIPASLAAGAGYATTADHLIPFNPVISTGPPVLAPIALAFKLFGTGLWQGRLVMLLYFIGAFALVGCTSARLYGKKQATLAVLLALAMPGVFEFGLKALGELPGVFWLLLGLLLLAQRRPVVAGLCFGLAALTKFLLVMTVAPLLALGVLETAVSWPAVRLPFTFYARAFAGFAAPLIGWEVVQYASLGLHGYLATKLGFYFLLKSGAGEAGSSGFQHRLHALQSAFGVPGVIVVFLAAIVFLHHMARLPRLVKAVKGDSWRLAEIFLIVFCGVNFAWWLFTPNQGWWRHTLPAALLFCPLIAYSLFCAVRIGVYSGLRTLLAAFCAWGGAVLLALLIVRQIASVFSQVASPELAYQKQAAASARSFVDSGGVIGYWDWLQAPEISFLAQRRFVDAFQPSTRQRLDRLPHPEKSVRLIVTPTQMESSPNSWVQERKFCGAEVDDFGGYRTFEYVPSQDFRKMYEFLLKRESLSRFQPKLSFLEEPANPAQIVGGVFPADGWAGPQASVWLPIDSADKSVSISGATPAGSSRPLTLQVTSMGVPLGEKDVSGGRFTATFPLPRSLQRYRYALIEVRASSELTYRQYLLENDRQNSAVGLKARLRRLIHESWPDGRALSFHLSEIAVSSDAASPVPSKAHSP
ncbi:MAG: glycosyltransferase family 39 protein [Armatimonadetes bacterium]|nr:glycosyltransferase family 39 protein [Armatimonadota bacterium]